MGRGTTDGVVTEEDGGNDKDRRIAERIILRPKGRQHLPITRLSKNKDRLFGEANVAGAFACVATHAENLADTKSAERVRLSFTSS